MTEENPTSVPVKPSNRHAKVSCETLSKHDLHLKQKSVPLNKHPRGVDRSFEVGQKAHGPRGKSRNGSKGRFSSVKISSCLSTGNAGYIVPNPMMSPARDELIGDGSVKAWAYAGPIPLSGSAGHVGSLPHTGSTKHRSGPVGGNSCPLRKQCVFAKRISAFTVIPADVIGKKKPPGYESDEPMSPVVTCIGRVRIKEKCRPWHWPAAIKECGEKKCKRGKKVNFESPGDDKRSSKQRSAKGVSKLQASEVDDLNCFSSSCAVTDAKASVTLFHSVNESIISYGDESHLSESKASVPPPDSLLLMRARSRNSCRLKEEPQSQCPVSVLTRLSRQVERQCPLASKRSSGGGIWSRRAIAQPRALVLKKPSNEDEKQDSTT